MIDFSKPIRRKAMGGMDASLLYDTSISPNLLDLERAADVKSVAFDNGRFIVEFVGCDARRLMYAPGAFGQQFENVPPDVAKLAEARDNLQSELVRMCNVKKTLTPQPVDVTANRRSMSGPTTPTTGGSAPAAEYAAIAHAQPVQHRRASNRPTSRRSTPPRMANWSW